MSLLLYSTEVQQAFFQLGGTQGRSQEFCGGGQTVYLEEGRIYIKILCNSKVFSNCNWGDRPY